MLLKCGYIHVWYFGIKAKIINIHKFIQGEQKENFSLVKKFFSIGSRIPLVSTVISAWRRACLCESFARACIHLSCTWTGSRSRYIGNSESRDDRREVDDAPYNSSAENYGKWSNRYNVDNRTSRRCRAWIYLEELLCRIRRIERALLFQAYNALINQRLDISIVHTYDSNRSRFGPNTHFWSGRYIYHRYTHKALFRNI